MNSLVIVMFLSAKSWKADSSGINDFSVSVCFAQCDMVSIEVKTNHSIKRGSIPSFRFWQAKIELDVISFYSSQNSNTDGLLQRLL